MRTIVLSFTLLISFALTFIIATNHRDHRADQADQGQVPTLDSHMEERRVYYTQILGLPETSTWTDITRFMDDVVRIKNAKARGLPLDSSWSDINEHDAKRRQQALRDSILT